MPIPWTATKEYAAHYQLDSDMFDFLVLCIDEMDKKFLSLKQEWLKTQNGTPG